VYKKRIIEEEKDEREQQEVEKRELSEEIYKLKQK